MLNAAMTEEALRESVVAFDLRRDVITVTGPDAAAYLQGQISQDVDGLAAGSSLWSLVLEPQGKVAAWFRISRFSDDDGETVFVIDLDQGHGEAALARLVRFKLRTKADFELTSGPMVAVRGPRGERPSTGRPLDFSWGESLGFDLLGDDGMLGASIERGDAVTFESSRIRSGFPALGAELTPSTIPAEAGIVEQSVSFTKGCYVGQELVARVDSRGNNTPKNLRGVMVSGDEAPVPGAELVMDGKPVGTVTSVGRSEQRGLVALAYVKRGIDLPALTQVELPSGATAGAELMYCPF